VEAFDLFSAQTLGHVVTGVVSGVIVLSVNHFVAHRREARRSIIEYQAKEREYHRSVRKVCERVSLYAQEIVASTEQLASRGRIEPTLLFLLRFNSSVKTDLDSVARDPKHMRSDIYQSLGNLYSEIRKIESLIKILAIGNNPNSEEQEENLDQVLELKNAYQNVQNIAVSTAQNAMEYEE
tara:strand:- start:414 stop:956 length:543 start_codon:yes stop_codon:yes gene_type:complete